MMNIQSIKCKLAKTTTALGFCLLVIGQQSCSDFLDLKPLNEVVLENYWTKKDDVTSVLMSCYESLHAKESITRMGLWGEARSDNMIKGNASAQELEQILKEDILPNNSYCNWTAFYQTINRCNITIHYAPIVQEIDPNYTVSEMKANIAEATFIRSLCYFYLIRTFRDVPFSREPSIDDSQEYRVPADSFNVVLNYLIEDLEAVKDDAQLYFYKPKPDEINWTAERTNTARVTRPAIYALLADLYLWQGDWQKCVECCDYVIDFKQKEYENLKRRLQDDVAFFNDIPLIREKNGGDIAGNAYNQIFGQGNSFEGIFELTFDESYSRKNGNDWIKNNDYVATFYANRNGTSVNAGYFAPFNEFYGDLPTQINDLFTSANDCRAYESMYKISQTSCVIAKYAADRITIQGTGSNLKASYNSWSAYSDGQSDANWIIYRLTDVVLMKAEALIQQGSDRFEEAFALINAVSKRAVSSFSPGVGEILKFDDHKDSQESMEQLVMDERHRELMFEGKRWYDLLRQARRTGSTRKLATTVTEKQVSNISGIQIRLADPNALYWPYYRNELKVNPYLKQNPAYHTGDDSDLEKN